MKLYERDVIMRTRYLGAVNYASRFTAETTITWKMSIARREGRCLRSNKDRAIRAITCCAEVFASGLSHTPASNILYLRGEANTPIKCKFAAGDYA